MSAWVSREQIVECVRRHRYSFGRQAPRVEIWRQEGTGRRINIPRRDRIPVLLVKAILHQAGLDGPEIERFLLECVKE